MRTLKPGFGVIGAVLPVLYCGGLLYHFLDTNGSVEEAKTDGLGPTLLGLGVVGLLFCIPLIVKIVRIFAGPRSPGSSGCGGPDGSAPDGEGGFDADAALARYMVQRSEEAAPEPPAVPPALDRGGRASRPSFGRRIG